MGDFHPNTPSPDLEDRHVERWPPTEVEHEDRLVGAFLVEAGRRGTRACGSFDDAAASLEARD